ATAMFVRLQKPYCTEAHQVLCKRDTCRSTLKRRARPTKVTGRQVAERLHHRSGNEENQDLFIQLRRTGTSAARTVTCPSAVTSPRSSSDFETALSCWLTRDRERPAPEIAPGNTANSSSQR